MEKPKYYVFRFPGHALIDYLAAFSGDGYIEFTEDLSEVLEFSSPQAAVAAINWLLTQSSCDLGYSVMSDFDPVPPKVVIYAEEVSSDV